MTPFDTLPAGVRLDAWPHNPVPEPPQDTPEIARLRELLRHSMPEFVGVLDLLASLRPVQDLAGRLAAGQPAKLTTQRS
jgi:hypothetical protein